MVPFPPNPPHQCTPEGSNHYVVVGCHNGRVHGATAAGAVARKEASLQVCVHEAVVAHVRYTVGAEYGMVPQRTRDPRARANNTHLFFS